VTDEGRVLVVDDDRPMVLVLEKALRKSGFDVVALVSGQEALARLAAEDFDVLLTDLRMAGMGGLELCERALAIRPDLPVIVITAFGSLEAAVGAMRAGAYDFLTKPFDVEVAAHMLRRAVQYRRLKDELVRLRSEAEQARPFRELLGQSAAMQAVYDLLDRLRDSDVTALVTGESGTGKELVARALHRIGRRSEGPFVAVNCAAVPEALLESELFGHAKGAFTDAKGARAGLFLRAHGGTLFLDEIGEMPVAMQAKLLRALETKTVRPIGADAEVEFDARLVAATNRDLLAAVEEGRFREDLYFRLAVIEIHVPPLRARGSDVLLLAQAFLERSARASNKNVTRIAPEAARRLLDYEWPGNVRELANCMERAVTLARFDQVTLEDLPRRISSYERSDVVLTATDSSELVSLEEVERRYILRVLHAVGGHRTEAARILGLDRKTLYRKLARWNASDESGEPE
jgi:DNA-binding NtrC family response regulator